MRTNDQSGPSVRVPGPMADRLRELAAANFHSVSAEARQAFAEHIARDRADVHTVDRHGEVRG